MPASSTCNNTDAYCVFGYSHTRCAVHVCRGRDIFTKADDLIIHDEGQDEVYHMGIIDILQQYDTKKSLETLFKSIVHKKDTISSVNPRQYGERFIRFLADITTEEAEEAEEED